MLAAEAGERVRARTGNEALWRAWMRAGPRAPVIWEVVLVLFWGSLGVAMDAPRLLSPS